VPEPTTMALLGCGLFAGLLRGGDKLSLPPPFWGEQNRPPV
jgi:hypothetical protein